MLATRSLFLLLFVYIGAHGNYFGIWLRDEAGWSEAEIGWQGGLHYACLILFPLLWGHRVDRTGDPGRVLRFIAVSSTLTFIPFVLTKAVIPLLVASVVFGAFRVGMVTTTDTYALAHITATKGDYGRIRIWGSAGFIVGGFLMAWIAETWGRDTIPASLMAVLAATAVLTCFLPGQVTLKPQQAESVMVGLRRLAARSDIRRFLLVSFGARLWSQGLYIFLPLHLTDIGIPQSHVAAYWAVGVVSEIILMGNAQRFFGTFATRRVLPLCLALAALQYALLAAVTDAYALFAVMLLHGMTFGIWYYASVTWLAKNLPVSDRARGQGMFQSVSFGVGGTLSAIICGYVYDLAGGPGMFGVTAAGVLLVALWGARTLP